LYVKNDYFPDFDFWKRERGLWQVAAFQMVPSLAGAWRQAPEKGGSGSLMDLSSHYFDYPELFFGKIMSINC
jgi:hypothetical protein